MFGIGSAIKKLGKKIDKKVLQPMNSITPWGMHKRSEKNRKAELAAVQAQHDEQMALLEQQQRVASASIDLGLNNTPEVTLGGESSTRSTRRRNGRGGQGSIATSLGIS